jgi:nucleoside-diphosphate-sugar epimerase
MTNGVTNASDIDANRRSEPAPDRVLVTGASGFIASHLVGALLDSGSCVIAVDRRSPAFDGAACANLSDVLSHPRLTFLPGDLNVLELDPLVEACDTVFHLAAVPGVRSSWGKQFDEYSASNIVATHRLIGACERAGVRRLVFASSSSVYGLALRPSREMDVTSPVSPYGVSKLAAEQLCLAHARRPDTKLTAVALRYFTVYGPRQRADMAITRVLAAAVTGQRVELYGDGTQRRDFTYVSDVVDATLAAASVDAKAVVVNVGGESSVSLLDIVQMAEQVTGRTVKVSRTGTQPGDVPATAADLTLARVLLDYKPKVTLPDGLSRHVKWLTGAGGVQQCGVTGVAS